MHRSLKAAALVSILLLAGCDMATPSQISVRQIELRNSVKTETLDALRADPARAEVIAESYRRNGRGPLSMTASYRADDQRDSAAVRKGGAAWRGLLLKNGIPAVNVDYVAVSDPAFADRAVLSWAATVASAPKDCGRIPGYQGAEDMSYAEKYSFGCETDAMIARQLSNPDDLRGRAGAPGNDAKRDGTLVDKYRSGTPNPKLQGINASSVGTGSGG